MMGPEITHIIYKEPGSAQLASSSTTAREGERLEKLGSGPSTGQRDELRAEGVESQGGGDGHPRLVESTGIAPSNDGPIRLMTHVGFGITLGRWELQKVKRCGTSSRIRPSGQAF